MPGAPEAETRTVIGLRAIDSRVSRCSSTHARLARIRSPLPASHISRQPGRRSIPPQTLWRLVPESAAPEVHVEQAGAARPRRGHRRRRASRRRSARRSIGTPHAIGLLVGSQRDPVAGREPDVMQPRCPERRGPSRSAQPAGRRGRSRSARRGRCGRRPLRCRRARPDRAASGSCRGNKAGLGVVHSPQQAAELGDDLGRPQAPARAPARPRRRRGSPDHRRRSRGSAEPVEAHRLEVPKERMDAPATPAARAAGAPCRRPATTSGDVAACERLSLTRGRSGRLRAAQPALLLRLQHRAHRLAHRRARVGPDLGVGQELQPRERAGAELVVGAAGAPVLVRVGAVRGRVEVRAPPSR